MGGAPAIDTWRAQGEIRREACRFHQSILAVARRVVMRPGRVMDATIMQPASEMRVLCVFVTPPLHAPAKLLHRNLVAHILPREGTPKKPPHGRSATKKVHAGELP